MTVEKEVQTTVQMTVEKEAQTSDIYKQNKKRNKNKNIKDIDIVHSSKNDKPEEKPNRFIKPTVNEIQKYCLERKNSINAEHFYDHYEARGWILSNGQKVKDWKACIRTWEQNSFKYSNDNKSNLKTKTSEFDGFNLGDTY